MKTFTEPLTKFSATKDQRCYHADSKMLKEFADDQKVIKEFIVAVPELAKRTWTLEDTFVVTDHCGSIDRRSLNKTLKGLFGVPEVERGGTDRCYKFGDHIVYFQYCNYPESRQYIQISLIHCHDGRFSN